MRMQVEREGIEQRSRGVPGVLQTRYCVVLPLERLSINFHQHIAVIVVAVAFQHHIFTWNLVWRLDRRAIDIWHIASIERASEALIVMYVTGENGIRNAPAGLNGLIENTGHVRAASVIDIHRIDGMVHSNNQGLILWGTT